MFSPLENAELDNWFQRLNAPLKRLPADERTEIHQEVRQHLEALAKANEELGSSTEEAWLLALTQFGDPGKFSKKMAQEWQQAKTGFRADMTAILVYLGLEAFTASVSWPVSWLTSFWASHYAHPLSLTTITNDICLYGLSTAALILVGRMFPFRALKGVFYVRVFSLLCLCLIIGVHTFLQPNALHPTLPILAHFLLLAPAGLLEALGVAYFASVTKRGWYRPSWADFKITLPQRRRQVN